MAFGMFSGQASPIAIDFGSASVKMLQIAAGERPVLLAAAELAVPESLRADPDKLFAFYAEWIPKFLRDGKFKGKRIVVAIPSGQTFTSHMQISEAGGGGVSRDDLIKGQLQIQMGVQPHGVVVRSIEVGPVYRNGQQMTEMICLAIGRETIMRYVEMLKKCRLEVVGVHTETMAMVRAFDHLCRRDADANMTTLFVDLGWGGTRVAVTHGRQLSFARYVPIGGKHFDQLIASTVHCDTASARAHRLSLQSTFDVIAQREEAAAIENAVLALQQANTTAVASGTAGKFVNTPAQSPAPNAVTLDRRAGSVPTELAHSVPKHQAAKPQVNVDLSELLDTISDELSMSLRYHQSLFKGRPIDRTVFVGGEARQTWLCQHMVKNLRTPAQLGDPLARYQSHGVSETPGLTLGQPQPGWAVACGLCNAPTDL